MSLWTPMKRGNLEILSREQLPLALKMLALKKKKLQCRFFGCSSFDPKGELPNLKQLWGHFLVMRRKIWKILHEKAPKCALIAKWTVIMGKERLLLSPLLRLFYSLCERLHGKRGDKLGFERLYWELWWPKTRCKSSLGLMSFVREVRKAWRLFWGRPLVSRKGQIRKKTTQPLLIWIDNRMKINWIRSTFRLSLRFLWVWSHIGSDWEGIKKCNIEAHVCLNKFPISFVCLKSTLIRANPIFQGY